MKRGIVVLVIVILGGALAGGWWWARESPEQAAQFLVNGGLQADRAEAFITSLGVKTVTEEEQGLLASGSIEAEEVAIVPEFGGRIVRLDVGEGDEVDAGQAVVELDSSSLLAEISQAAAAVVAAEASLENIRAGAHPAEILAAEAAVLHAVAERDAARTAWQDVQHILENPQEIKAQIVEAEAAVDLAQAEIEQAHARIASIEAERDKYRAQGSLQEKQLFRALDYQVKAARAGLDAAVASKAGQAESLAALKALRDHPLALLSQVHAAEATYRILERGLDVAEAKLAEVKAGPTPEEIGVAEAQIARAKAAVSALQARKDKLTLRTPISGVVTSRTARSGEAAVAGATLLTVASLDEVFLTIYIPEDELARVVLGQEVGVEVDSFPGDVFTGTVSYISQRAEFTPKNVQTEKERVNMVFAVRVRLLNPDHLLKPGMPADAVLTGD